jgi:hypothetical protein
MRRPLRGILLVLLLTALGATRCVHHIHHGHRSAVVLDAEHHDAKVVVVHKRPAPRRHCWKHRRHWHWTS